MSIASIKFLCRCSSLTAGIGSNYKTRCALQLPIVSQGFSFLRSLEAEKRLPEVTGGFVYLAHKAGSGGPRGLGF